MDGSGRRDVIVIPKDKAVFWMDGAGRWHNRHGVFQHKKIIDYFNASIQKDEDGYYLTQYRGDVIEKVYFAHAETALFVVDVAFGHPSVMTLNTGIEIEMTPEALFIYKEEMFYRMEDQLVKFNQRALLKISEKMNYDQGRYVLDIPPVSMALEERKRLPTEQKDVCNTTEIDTANPAGR